MTRILPAWILMLLCLTSSITVMAQEAKLKGRIIDETQQPVAFANAAILRWPDSTLAGGTAADKDGRFELVIAPGNYRIRLSALGFTERFSETITIGAAGDVDLGVLQLNRENKKMEEVKLNVLRPTITQLPDRMVVSIEGTALAAGNTAYSVLTRAPGVFIDADGNIQLNGRSGVLVMLNGKQTYLSARELRNLLESMPAENIRDIEVITSPSSRFDAEGTGGILNINLKRNNRQGVNGSVATGATNNDHQWGYAHGLSLNHKQGRWNSFGTLDIAQRVGGRRATFTREFHSTGQSVYFDQTATGQYNNESFALRAGTDYDISNTNSIGFTLGLNRNNSTSNFLTDTYLGAAPKQPSRLVNADNFDRNRYNNLALNGHYLVKLDSIGSTFTADLDFVKIRNQGNSNFYNYYTNLPGNAVQTDFLFTDIPSGYEIYAAKADVIRQLPRGRKLEWGAKGSRVISDNDSRFYFNNGTPVIDPSRTNHFNYRETILAAYGNWSTALSSKLTMQAGLRAEHTISRGESYTTNTLTRRNYLNFFPSIFFQQKVSENYGINYNYSRRLTRPGYGTLNPFRFYRDPLTYSEGNPYLRPQYTHMLSIVQSFFKRYFLTTTFMINRDIITELPILVPGDATTIYTTGNVKKGYYAGATAVAPLRISKNWEIQNTLQLTYNQLKALVDGVEIVNERLSYFFQSNHTIQLPKAFRLEVLGWYRGPSVSGLYQIEPMWRVDAGLRKTMFNKKLEFSANATDIFQSQRFKFATRINGNINDFDQYLRWRTFSISLRYNFSYGQKVDNRKRNNSLEELNRT